jgi:UDP-glucuronate decarboxylase
MNSVLVAGGAGFIGSNLCQKLLEKGEKVICVDNFSTSSKENIKKLLLNKNFSFIFHDVTNPLNIKADIIINLASPASPVNYQKRPVKTIKTNILGSINLLENALKNNSLIFLASTSEVYGDPLQHPQKETYWGNVNPIGLRSCYDEGKRCAETLFFDYYREFGTKIKIARIFNTYGPNMVNNDGRVVTNFIINALNNKPLRINGRGNITRSFCFVDDLIDGIFAFIYNSKNFTGPLNIGSDNEISILTLARTIIKLTKSNSKIEFIKKVSDDPQKRKPDLSLAKKIINWNPKFSLGEGLLKTIDYFKEKL